MGLRGFLAFAAVVLVFAAGCQPGLGHQVSAHDFAFAFTQRDDITIRTLSTKELRSAVWDRLEGANEFRSVAAILAHGQHGDVVDSQFREQEAIIQFRTEGKAQYRLYLVYQDDDWRVDDVVKETAPGVYVSMRRQAEAVLAVRDFRRALEGGDAAALIEASSEALSRDTWRSMSATQKSAAESLLSKLIAETDGPLGDVYVPEHEHLAAHAGAPEQQYTFYFVKERGRLVVDDVAVPQASSPLRVLLREGARP